MTELLAARLRQLRAGSQYCARESDSTESRAEPGSAFRRSFRKTSAARSRALSLEPEAIRPDCGHRAGHDHHRVKSRRAADERYIQIKLGMLRDRGRDLETVDLLFGNLFGMRTHDEMHLMRAAIDLIQQPLQVDRSARARGSNDQFHLKKFGVSLNSIENRGNKVIMVKKLLHTRYRVTDLEKTVSFYKDVLGLKETARHTSGPRIAARFSESAGKRGGDRAVQVR